MKASMKYIGIAGVIIVVIGGVSLWSRQSDTVGSGTPANDRFPEQSITHGHGLAVDVGDPNTLYIATHEGLLVLVNDQDLYRIGKRKDDYMGFSAHPTAANVFFTSGHPRSGGNLGFQRSDDGGITWKKVSSGAGGPVDFHAMAVSPVDPNIIYGWYRGALQRSDDQGERWDIVNRELVVMSLAADSRDAGTVYAATPNGLLVSRDRGERWASLSTALDGGAVSAVAVHPQDADTLLVFSERLGGLGKSTDAGSTWSKVRGLDGATVLHLAFSRSVRDTAYALTRDNALYKSTDGGEVWSRIR